MADNGFDGLERQAGSVTGFLGNGHGGAGNDFRRLLGEKFPMGQLVDKKSQEKDEHGHHQIGPGNRPVDGFRRAGSEKSIIDHKDWMAGNRFHGLDGAADRVKSLAVYGGGRVIMFGGIFHTLLISAGWRKNYSDIARVGNEMYFYLKRS